jgi:flavin-binding protein dodecin
MNLNIRILFFLSFLTCTVSCGFQPIYQADGGKEKLLEFNLRFNNEVSYEIKNTIKNTFQTSEDTAIYTIGLKIVENRSPLITNSNGTVSKYRVEVMISFEVHNNDSGKKVYNDVSRGFSEYLVQTSEIQTNEKFKQAIETATREAVQMMSIKIQTNILQSQ